MARKIGTSPLGVFITGFSVLVVWMALYGPAQSQEAAVKQETPPTLKTEVAVPEGPSVEVKVVAKPSTVVRQGPRLLEDPKPDQLGLSIAIEDADGKSMEKLHAALARAKRGEGQARLVFYGASHVASDTFTSMIRREFQDRFGDAGHGMVLPVHPWKSYRHKGVTIESNRAKWSSTKTKATTSDIDHFGVHGVFVETDQAGAYGIARTTKTGTLGRKASLFDLYYLKQPGGGDFDIKIDGQRLQRVKTASVARAPGYATFRVPDGAHQFELRTLGNGKVRIFGVAVEREKPGVIVDTLGINGARARYHLMWDDAMYREHLKRRAPDLVVLAYGTNESGDDLPIAEYEAQMNAVVTRVKATAPQASCLLIGPSDRPVRVDDNQWEDRPRTAQLIAVQHRVAVQQGCGFFDMVAFQGGALSMVKWSANEPPFGAPDHIHYTRRGYARMGEVLIKALLEGFVEPNQEATNAPEAP